MSPEQEKRFRKAYSFHFNRFVVDAEVHLDTLIWEMKKAGYGEKYDDVEEFAEEAVLYNMHTYYKEHQAQIEAIKETRRLILKPKDES
jgi:hypothetical protein